MPEPDTFEPPAYTKPAVQPGKEHVLGECELLALLGVDSSRYRLGSISRAVGNKVRVLVIENPGEPDPAPAYQVGDRVFDRSVIQQGLGTVIHVWERPSGRPQYGVRFDSRPDGWTPREESDLRPAGAEVPR